MERGRKQKVKKKKQFWLCAVTASLRTKAIIAFNAITAFVLRHSTTAKTLLRCFCLWWWAWPFKAVKDRLKMKRLETIVSIAVVFLLWRKLEQAAAISTPGREESRLSLCWRSPFVSRYLRIPNAEFSVYICSTSLLVCVCERGCNWSL